MKVCVRSVVCARGVCVVLCARVRVVLCARGVFLFIYFINALQHKC